MKFIVLLVTFLFFVMCFARKLDFDFASRIVGGNNAKENQFPHQIAIFYKGSLRCGGSIVSESWVLTAAHCLVSGKEA